ncbi:hypothetical protein DERP_009738 [Dermatophagoides pteronyssinus]|uniref:Uncharacterized protein n=1 Tax=Dermatophagoides pteronyssinus TaxID=6956 RepID=A0ABQ8IRA2_DERPT|nr:hypothetical protein DERP_009738 [Dermatophagoides pteronyssinus]
MLPNGSSVSPNLQAGLFINPAKQSNRLMRTTNRILLLNFATMKPNEDPTGFSTIHHSFMSALLPTPPPPLLDLQHHATQANTINANITHMVTKMTNNTTLISFYDPKCHRSGMYD